MIGRVDIRNTAFERFPNRVYKVRSIRNTIDDRKQNTLESTKRNRDVLPRQPSTVSDTRIYLRIGYLCFEFLVFTYFDFDTFRNKICECRFSGLPKNSLIQ